jgi:hypothetical protein
VSSAGNKNISKPSQVDRARERLDKAVLRLETAITNSGSKQSQALNEDVEALRAENTRLGKASSEVSVRLEKTIGRLNAVLES